MSIFTGAPDIAADLISGTFGPIGAAAASLAEQTFTDNTVEEMKANNERYNEALNYDPRTNMGKAVNKGAMEAIGEGTAAVVNYYNENEEKIPDVVKSSVGAVADTWNDLDESTRFALGNLATVGEVVPIGKAASMLRRGSKLAPEDIMPDGVPVKDPMQPTPELQQNSALRLPAERAAMTPNVDELGYTSGIEEGIIAMINDPKVPDNVSAKQLMDLLKKRGVKDDEIEWSTFSDYVGTLGKKQLPLEEALRQARDRAITLEVIEIPEGSQSFPEYSPYGGENYSELLFKFDTIAKIKAERSPLRIDRDALKAELKSLNTQRKNREFDMEVSMHEKSPNSGVSSSFLDKYKMQEAVENEMPLSKLEIKKTKELKELTDRIDEINNEITNSVFKGGHWRSAKRRPDIENIIFHARTTDREINGDDSLAIDEIQSDWHQGVGDVEDRPFYRLPKDQLERHIDDRFYASEKTKDALYQEMHLLEGGTGDIRKQYNRPQEDKRKKSSHVEEYKAQVNIKNPNYPNEYSVGYILKQIDSITTGAYKKYVSYKEMPEDVRESVEGWVGEIEVIEARHPEIMEKLDGLITTHSINRAGRRNLATEGYNKFTKGLRPNAPLKNKDKWMGAVLNAMLYKAVKGGYGSVSFPNGKTQSDLYRGTLDENQIKALEKMYDTTVPNMLTKMAKKLDPNAKLIRGKDSSVTKPLPSKPSRATREEKYTEEEWAEVLEEYEEDIWMGLSEGRYNDVNSGYSFIEITVEMKNAILKGSPLFLAKGGYVSGAVDVATDFLSGTFGPIGAAGASLAEQAFTDNTVEEMKANNEQYNDFLNYKPRTQMGRSANESFLETMGEGAEAVVNYYNENEESIPDVVKDTVGSVADTWNDLDESTRFALGNLATVGEVVPMGKAASLIKKGINEAAGTRRINLAASKVPDESAYIDVQERLAANGSRQEMVIARDVEEMPSVESAIEPPAYVVPTPKKTVKAYKLFRVDPEQPGKLFTLFVDSKTPVAMNEWVESKDVYFFTASNGRKYVPTTGGKMGTSVNIPDEATRKELQDAGFPAGGKAITCVAYRPGFHAGESPSSSHIGSKEPGMLNAKGKPYVNTRRPNEVWAEVEMPDDVDWQSRANAAAKTNKDGTMNKASAHITDEIPFGGFYNYKTTAAMTGDWRISGSIKVNRVLSDDEVLGLNLKAGHEDMVRREPRVDEGVVYDNAPAPTKIDTEMEELSDTSATKPKVIRFKDVSQPELSQEQLSKSFKNGEITAYGRNIARKRAATDMAGQTKQVRKLSEILGGLNVEGKTKITATQSDRTGILDGAGPGYPLIGRQYAEMAKLFQDEFGKAPVPKMLDENGEISDYPVWAVDDAGTMTSLMNNVSMENGLLVPMIGSVTQLRTNKEVFKKLKKEFMKGVKANKLSSEQAEKININLEALTGKKLDIREPSDWSSLENTFDDRGALADIMSGTKPILIGDKKWIKGREATNKDRAKSGLAPLPMNPKSVPLGGKKGQIFDYSKVLEDATEFILLGSKTFSLGPKIILPSRYGKTETMRDAHPGFEENAFGQVAHDGIFMPAPMEIVMPDFINFGHRKHLEEGKTTAFTPNQWGMNARMGYKGFGLPSQVIDEKYLKSLQDKGYNEGGLVEEMDSILD